MYSLPNSIGTDLSNRVAGKVKLFQKKFKVTDNSVEDN